MGNKIIDVTVIMATFNPVWNKCVFTLDSIIMQKNIKIELIVVDDGSSDNLFANYEAYFAGRHFSDYIFISHEKNRGTVKSYYDGLKLATGRLIKLISPGDALFNENTLADWAKYLDESGKTWSFADSLYYTEENGAVQIIKGKAAPRVIDCYLKDNADICRWNYVVLEDIALGSAILCEREQFIEYISEIVGKVIYAEDLSFMHMMYDGIVPSYYQKNCVIYEFGSGISTSEDNNWKVMFQNDLKTAEMHIAKRACVEDIQRKMSKALISMNSGSVSKKRVIKNIQKGGLKKVLTFRLCPRLSSDDYSSAGSWWKEYAQS